MALKKSVSNIELLNLIQNNNVTIIDVRSGEDFDKGHISGATNISVDDLSSQHLDLSGLKPIVTYCGKGRGRSEAAATLLTENGKKAFWLEGGYSEWIALKPKPAPHN